MQHRYFKWFYAHGFMLMFCSCAFVCFRLKTVLLFATFRSFVCSCFVDFSFHLKAHPLDPWTYLKAHRFRSPGVPYEKRTPAHFQFADLFGACLCLLFTDP